MANPIKWNLSSTAYKSISLFSISVSQDESNYTSTSTKYRLQIYSHFLSSQSIPSIFLDSPPPYLSDCQSCPLIVTFDISHKFEPKSLPFWAVSTAHEIPELNGVKPELLKHLQIALTTAQLYDLREMDPIFHTTFIIIPRPETSPFPIIMQKIPVIQDGRILIRSVSVIFPDLISPYPSTPPPLSRILIPPFENPMIVSDISESDITVHDASGKAITFSTNFTKFSLLTLKNRAAVSKRVSQNKLGATFREIHSFKVSMEAIQSAISGRYEHSAGQTGKPREDVTQIVDGSEEPAGVIPELAADESLRGLILESIGLQFQYSVQVSQVSQVYIPKGLGSIYSLDFFKASPIQKFGKPPEFQSIQCETFSEPNLLINAKGVVKAVKAGTAIQSWEEELYEPISGGKDATYIIFIPSSAKEESALDFMSELSHYYMMLKLGSLSHRNNTTNVTLCRTGKVQQSIEDYIAKNRIVEFYDHPLLIFAFEPVFTEYEEPPKSYIFTLSTSDLAEFSERDFKDLAFDVYSRIRLQHPAPNGLISGESDLFASNLFNGFRFQPPFVLSRSENSMTIHVGYEPTSGLSVWCDDIGSVLKVQRVNGADEIVNFLIDIQRFLGQNLRSVTLSIISESIESSTLSILTEGLATFKASVFSLFPSSQVQLCGQAQSDMLIFSSKEQVFSTGSSSSANSLNNCFVVSPYLESYSISIYWTNIASADAALKEFAGQMHSLSWLSVRPGRPMRGCSLPIHISYLLQSARVPLISLSRIGALE